MTPHTLVHLKNGVVSEHLILEANGSTSLNSDEDGRLDLDGEVSLLRFEVMDIAGQVKQDSDRGHGLCVD